MNQQYAICITGCNITDEKHTKEPLKKGGLLRVLDVSEQTGNCRIKIFSDGNTVIEFNKTIHTCEFKNIRIVPQNLFLFLINADYEGRLNILENEKTILELGVGSKVKLKFINSDKKEYTIEFVINYIGTIKTLGIGNFIGLNFAHFGALRDFGSILTKIHEQFYHKCDEVTSIIVVRVEQLFTDIELYDLLQPNLEREWMKEFSLLDNTIKNMSTMKMSNVPEITSQYQDAEIIETRDVDQQFLTNELNKLNSSTVTDNKYNHNAKLLELDLERSNKNKAKMCVACFELKDLSTFPCGHPFCYKCLLERLDQVKLSSTAQCLNCNSKLHIEEAKKLQQFLDENLGKEENRKTKNENDYPTHQENSPYRKQDVKRCEQCFDLENLFTFSCGDAFCYKCLVLQSNHIKKGKNTACPKCKANLQK